MTLDQILIGFIQDIFGLVTGFLEDLFQLLADLFGKAN